MTHTMYTVCSIQGPHRPLHRLEKSLQREDYWQSMSTAFWGYPIKCQTAVGIELLQTTTHRPNSSTLGWTSFDGNWIP